MDKAKEQRAIQYLRSFEPESDIQRCRKEVVIYLQKHRNDRMAEAIYDARDFKGEQPMSKYIKAEEAAEKISEKYGIPLHELVDVFADIPAADAKEVKYGYWKYDDGLDIICSRCGRLALTPHYSSIQCRSAYCPYCGAKMEGGQDI